MRIKVEILSVLLLVAMTAMLALNLPGDNEYGYMADEGHYLEYAETIQQEGFIDGLRNLSEAHAKKPDKFIWPSPLRIFHVLLSWIFVSLFGGIVGLSWLSIVSYALLIYLSFRFVRKHFGDWPALLFVILLASAPLGLGMARRALMDSTNYLMVVATTLVFLRYLRTPSMRWLAAFVIMHVLLVLEKDPNVMFLPGFALVWLFFYLKYRPKYRITDGLTAAVAISGLLLTSYAAFNGWDNFVSIFSALGRGVTINEYTFYHFLYQQGPWYRVVIDYILLSPMMVLGGLLCAGYYLAKKEQWKFEVPVISFIFMANVVAVIFLTINVRYINYLEWLFLFYMAIMLPVVIKDLVRDPRWTTPISVILIVALGVYNLAQFNRVFLENRVYDPINYYLMEAAGVSPDYSLDTFSKKPVVPEVQQIPNIDSLFQLGAQKYQAGDFVGCIFINRQVLDVQPNNAGAWNNICAAYNEMQQYDAAIEACNHALAIDSTNQITHNNLNWALTQKEATGSN